MTLITPQLFHDILAWFFFLLYGSASIRQQAVAELKGKPLTDEKEYLVIGEIDVQLPWQFQSSQRLSGRLVKPARDDFGNSHGSRGIAVLRASFGERP